MNPTITNTLLSPQVLYWAPRVLGGFVGGTLLGKCVFEVPKSHLIKNIVENLLIRPLNAAASAALIARVFTPIAPFPAFMMGGLIFLTARVCMFAMDILMRDQWNHKPRGNEERRLNEWSHISMAAGGGIGLYLGNLALDHWHFAPISFPTIVGVGVGTIIPAAVGWEILKRVSDFAFRSLGWRELPSYVQDLASFSDTDSD